MVVLLCVQEMANQGVELTKKHEEESYREGLTTFLKLFNDAQLAEFKASCFGHLKSVDRLAFVENQGVNDLKGLTYLIGCEVTRFINKDFCLIMRLHCDESYDLEYFPQKLGFVGESNKGKGKGKGKVVKGKGKVKTTPKKATKKVLVTCVELQMAFKQCEDEDDALKIRLVYFADGMLISLRSNVWTYEKIAKLEKPLRYCKMINPVAVPRILQWSTTNRQPIHEQV
ncbi:unnamed protein product [Malus baccata var. baccata]